MQRKRVAVDTLTGGTGDVNGQILRAYSVVGPSNTAGLMSVRYFNFPNPAYELNRQLVGLPIQMSSSSRPQYAYAMEVLRVILMAPPFQYSLPAGTDVSQRVGVGLRSETDGAALANNTSNNNNEFYGQILGYGLAGSLGLPNGLSDAPVVTVAASPNQPQPLAYWIKSTTAEVATFQTNTDLVGKSEWDLTDSAGHGVLVTTPYLSLIGGYRTSIAEGLSGAAPFGCDIFYRLKAIPFEEYLNQLAFSGTN
jgi:hypothetical protein